MRSISKLLGCITIFFLIVGLFWRVQKETERANFAEREVGIQADVIAKQVFHFNRFNKISAYTSNLNSLINAGTEKKLSNTGRFSVMKRPVISLFLLMWLVGCSNTRTVYVPAQCTPLPMDLTTPILTPLPPAR